jgi:hypothetical protein
MTTKTFVALTPIQHDGREYAEGAKVELTESQAEQLLALKAVAPTRARQKAAGDGQATGKPEGQADGGADDAADGQADDAPAGDSQADIAPAADGQGDLLGGADNPAA